MQKVINTFVLCFILTQALAQTQTKVSTFLLAQYDNTMYDLTKGNNPWGVGLGLQTFLNNKTRFKPTIELTGDVYLEDDKVFRTDANGNQLNDVRGMVNLFLGSSFNAGKNIYLSFVAGPSFISGQTLLGVKPSVGFYFPSSQRWIFKISYINVVNRGKIIKQDFGSLSLAVGLKLF